MALLDFKHVATNDTDRTIEVSINGKRYTYEITDSFESVKHVFNGLMKNSPGKALNFLKRQGKVLTNS